MRSTLTLIQTHYDKHKYSLGRHTECFVQWFEMHGDTWVQGYRELAIWEMDCSLGAIGETEKLRRHWLAGQKDIPMRGPGKCTVYGLQTRIFAKLGFIERPKTHCDQKTHRMQGRLMEMHRHLMLGLFLKEDQVLTWKEVWDQTAGDTASSHLCDNRPCVDPFTFTPESDWTNLQRTRCILEEDEKCDHKPRFRRENH